MLSLTHLLLSANLLALGLLCWRHWAAQRALAVTARQLEQLPVSQLSKPELSELLGKGSRDIIAIEILNPMELAAKESWFADRFGSLTPALIRRIVYARTLEIIGPQLDSFGVKADVRLHRAA
jgi:hypothetical protein